MAIAIVAIPVAPPLYVIVGIATTESLVEVALCEWFF